MLRQLAGSTLSEEDLNTLVTEVLQVGGPCLGSQATITILSSCVLLCFSSSTYQPRSAFPSSDSPSSPSPTCRYAAVKQPTRPGLHCLQVCSKRRRPRRDGGQGAGGPLDAAQNVTL
jgi:hypothetical protein